MKAEIISAEPTSVVDYHDMFVDKIEREKVKGELFKSEAQPTD